MKNEVKIIIGLSVFCCILVGIIVWGIFDNINSDSRYRQAIRERDKAFADLESASTELNSANFKFEKYKQNTDKIISKLNDTITDSGKIVESLQNIRNTLEGTDNQIGTEVEGIRQILKEIMAGDN